MTSSLSADAAEFVPLTAPTPDSIVAPGQGDGAPSQRHVQIAEVPQYLTSCFPFVPLNGQSRVETSRFPLELQYPAMSRTVPMPAPSPLRFPGWQNMRPDVFPGFPPHQPPGAAATAAAFGSLPFVDGVTTLQHVQDPMAKNDGLLPTPLMAPDLHTAASLLLAAQTNQLTPPQWLLASAVAPQPLSHFNSGSCASPSSSSHAKTTVTASTSTSTQSSKIQTKTSDHNEETPGGDRQPSPVLISRSAQTNLPKHVQGLTLQDKSHPLYAGSGFTSNNNDTRLDRQADEDSDSGYNSPKQAKRFVSKATQVVNPSTANTTITTTTTTSVSTTATESLTGTSRLEAKKIVSQVGASTTIVGRRCVPQKPAMKICERRAITDVTVVENQPTSTHTRKKTRRKKHSGDTEEGKGEKTSPKSHHALGSAARLLSRSSSSVSSAGTKYEDDDEKINLSSWTDFPPMMTKPVSIISSSQHDATPERVPLTIERTAHAPPWTLKHTTRQEGTTPATTSDNSASPSGGGRTVKPDLGQELSKLITGTDVVPVLASSGNKTTKSSLLSSPSSSLSVTSSTTSIVTTTSTCSAVSSVSSHKPDCQQISHNSPGSTHPKQSSQTVSNVEAAPTQHATSLVNPQSNAASYGITPTHTGQPPYIPNSASQRYNQQVNWPWEVPRHVAQQSHYKGQQPPPPYQNVPSRPIHTHMNIPLHIPPPGLNLPPPGLHLPPPTQMVGLQTSLPPPSHMSIPPPSFRSPARHISQTSCPSNMPEPSTNGAPGNQIERPSQYSQDGAQNGYNALRKHRPGYHPSHQYSQNKRQAVPITNNTSTSTINHDRHDQHPKLIGVPHPQNTTAHGPTHPTASNPIFHQTPSTNRPPPQNTAAHGPTHPMASNSMVHHTPSTNRPPPQNTATHRPTHPTASNPMFHHTPSITNRPPSPQTPTTNTHNNTNRTHPLSIHQNVCNENSKPSYANTVQNRTVDKTRPEHRTVDKTRPEHNALFHRGNQHLPDQQTATSHHRANQHLPDQQTATSHSPGMLHNSTASYASKTKYHPITNMTNSSYKMVTSSKMAGDQGPAGGPGVSGVGQLSELAAQEAAGPDEKKRRRRRRRGRGRSIKSGVVDDDDGDEATLGGGSASPSLSHALSSSNVSESTLHFEDVDEFPDLLSGSRGGITAGGLVMVCGDEVGAERATLSGNSLSYSDAIKTTWPKDAGNRSRSQSLGYSGVSCDDDDDDNASNHTGNSGMSKRARKRRRRREQANQAAEAELAEISLEQQWLRQVGLGKSPTRGGLISQPKVVGEAKEAAKGPKAVAAGKKTQEPIAFDIAAMISAIQKSPSKGAHSGLTRSSAGSVARPSRKENVREGVGNLLDSSAPLQKRGKERELAKSKKPSPLKKVILKEREQRKRLRLLDEDPDVGASMSTGKSGIGTATGDSELSQEGLSSKSEGTDDPEASAMAAELSADLSPISQTSPISMSPASPGNSGVSSPSAGSIGRDPVIMKIHSRRFREYCTQILDKDIDQCCSSLLQELVKFQDRMYHKDPVKAKTKRRVVLGLREVTKHLRLKRIKCVVISPNLEKIQSKGGLDEALNTILTMCQEQNVPFVFALGRRALGRACAKLVPVSVVGVFNYEGCESKFNSLISLTAAARDTYHEMVQAVEREVAEHHPASQVSSIGGVPGLFAAHMGHSRTPSGCSAISFTSSILSEPISENFPHAEPEVDSKGYEIVRDAAGNVVHSQAPSAAPPNDIDDGNEADVEDMGDNRRRKRLGRNLNSVRFGDEGVAGNRTNNAEVETYSDGSVKVGCGPGTEITPVALDEAELTFAHEPDNDAADSEQIGTLERSSGSSNSKKVKSSSSVASSSGASSKRRSKQLTKQTGNIGGMVNVAHVESIHNPAGVPHIDSIHSQSYNLTEAILSQHVLMGGTTRSDADNGLALIGDGDRVAQDTLDDDDEDDEEGFSDGESDDGDDDDDDDAENANNNNNDDDDEDCNNAGEDGGDEAAVSARSHQRIIDKERIKNWLESQTTEPPED